MSNETAQSEVSGLDAWRRRREKDLAQRKSFLLMLIKERARMHQQQLKELLAEELQLDSHLMNHPRRGKEIRGELSRLCDRRRRTEMEYWRDIMQLRVQLHEVELEEISDLNLLSWKPKTLSEN